MPHRAPTGLKLLQTLHNLLSILTRLIRLNLCYQRLPLLLVLNLLCPLRREGFLTTFEKIILRRFETFPQLLIRLSRGIPYRFPTLLKGDQLLLRVIPLLAILQSLRLQAKILLLLHILFPYGILLLLVRPTAIEEFAAHAKEHIPNIRLAPRHRERLLERLLQRHHLGRR